MKAIAIALLSLLALAGPGVAQGQGQGRGREHPERVQRRAELEQEVRRRFLGQVARRLELTEGQREALVGTLREGGQARQELAQESRALRRELLGAVRDENTPTATYDRLLERLESIREAERAIERREQAGLAEVLDARQRAMFLIMRMQFNDRVRGVRGPAGGRGGPPGRI